MIILVTSITWGKCSQGFLSRLNICFSKREGPLHLPARGWEVKFSRGPAAAGGRRSLCWSPGRRQPPRQVRHSLTWVILTGSELAPLALGRRAGFGLDAFLLFLRKLGLVLRNLAVAAVFAAPSDAPLLPGTPISTSSQGPGSACASSPGMHFARGCFCQGCAGYRDGEMTPRGASQPHHGVCAAASPRAPPAGGWCEGEARWDPVPSDCVRPGLCARSGGPSFTRIWARLIPRAAWSCPILSHPIPSHLCHATPCHPIPPLSFHPTHPHLHPHPWLWVRPGYTLRQRAQRP